MSLGFLGQSDGRLHRARRTILKLLALGVPEREVIKLIRHHEAHGNEQYGAQIAARQDVDKDKRRKEAQWAIHTMLALGFTESEIAARACVEHTSITRAILPTEPRVLGQNTVLRLMQAVQNAGAERLERLLPRVAIKILDTCSDKGRELDDVKRAEIESRARVDLQNALIFASSPAPMVPGTPAFLSQVGDPVHGLYLIKVPAQRDEGPNERLTHLRLIEHELEHLLDRFREERKRLEYRQRPVPDLPKEGSIA